LTQRLQDDFYDLMFMYALLVEVTRRQQH